MEVEVEVVWLLGAGRWLRRRSHTWYDATRRRTKGWITEARIFFSLTMWRSCFVATTWCLRTALSAYVAPVGLWRTRRTRPKAPTPRSFCASRSFQSGAASSDCTFASSRRAASTDRISFSGPSSSSNAARPSR